MAQREVRIFAYSLGIPSQLQYINSICRGSWFISSQDRKIIQNRLFCHTFYIEMTNVVKSEMKRFLICNIIDGDNIVSLFCSILFSLDSRGVNPNKMMNHLFLESKILTVKLKIPCFFKIHYATADCFVFYNLLQTELSNVFA